MTTHIYEEDMDTISHGDDAAMMSAIDAAIEEVQGYLTKYDTGKIFAARGKERNPILLLFVKDIAVWHFVNLCNAGTDLQLRQDRYERAVAWLRQVQKSDIKPNLPIIDEDGDGKPDTAGEYIYGSNPKRNQHF